MPQRSVDAGNEPKASSLLIAAGPVDLTCYVEPIHVLTLEGGTKLVRADRVRIEHNYELTRPADNVVIATAETTLVHVDGAGKLQAIPEMLKVGMAVEETELGK